MKRMRIVVVALFLSSLGPAAWAAPLQPYDQAAADQKAVPDITRVLRRTDESTIHNRPLSRFGQGPVEPKTRIPKVGIVVALAVLVFGIVGGRLAYRASAKMLEDQNAVGRHKKRAADEGAAASAEEQAAPAEEPTTAEPDPLQETILSALETTDQFMTVEWVANRAKIDEEAALRALNNLALDGHLERSRDKFGRNVFRRV